MSNNQVKFYKFTFMLGLALLVTSLFLDWYYIQVQDSSGNTIAAWSYNIFTRWSTRTKSDGSLYDKISHPKEIAIPLAISVLYVCSIAASGYTVAFKNLEKEENLEKLSYYSYIVIFLLMLNLYYVFLFPVMYLLPNNLYYPFMRIKDEELGVYYFYYVGPGYILQCVAFVATFPFAYFYYKTVAEFKAKQREPVRLANEYMEAVKEPLDIDKLIAKEQLKLKFKKQPIKVESYNVKKKAKRRA